MNLLLLLTAFMASLTGIIAGERGMVRAGSVSAASVADMRVALAPRAGRVSHRPAAAAPRPALRIDGRVVAGLPVRLIAMLGRRLI